MSSPRMDISQSRLTRRQMLKASAAVSVSGLLGSLIGNDAAAATTSPASRGLAPNQASNETGTWTAMSWDGAVDIKKWEKPIGDFFKKYYPKMKWDLQYGLTWDNYWTKLQTVIAGGASPD